MMRALMTKTLKSLIGVAYASLVMSSVPVLAGDIVNHLATPLIYDTALALPRSSGQTFLSDGQYVTGVDVYIADPTRLADPCCDTISGLAELHLYDATDLSDYILLSVKQFDGSKLPVGTPASIDFDSPIPTVSGKRYAFFIFADDNYGLGLRSQTASTYSGGDEVLYPDDGNQIETGDEGRDLSFAVRGIESISELVLKTGQSTCYDISGAVISCAGTGQDGEYKKGIVDALTRFTDNSDGTITDNKTGLIWVQQILCAFAINWQQALDHANNLSDGQCGLTDDSVAGDWRLPNYRELQSLNWQYNVSTGDSGLPVSNSFTLMNNGFIWSSTSNHPVPQYAHCLTTDGGSSPLLKGRADIAGSWAVRDAPRPQPPAMPQITSIEPGDTQVSVSVSVSDDGGSPITGYTAACYGDSIFFDTSSTSSITVSGLTNGQAYVCVVSATNDVGSSPISEASASVTPVAPPPGC
jgi:hypothetical protein